MTDDEILDIFRATGAYLEGHFILTSGRHSPTYFQCARVLQYPIYLTLFGRMIADQFEDQKVDLVLSPAVGGVVLGTEVGRQLGVRTIFAEREGGRMTLRRGFTVNPGERVLIVEDVVVTTGGSVREVMDLVRAAEATIVGVGMLVDRSNGKVQLHEVQYAVTRQEAISYDPDEVPEALARIPAVKPGSRELDSALSSDFETSV
jgi:orotate phosphoribosyltransferase